MARRNKARKRIFKSTDIEIVLPAGGLHDDREPFLKIGDVVRLVSGGPNMLVVDIEHDYGVFAYRDSGIVDEIVLPLMCVCRVRNLW